MTTDTQNVGSASRSVSAACLVLGPALYAASAVTWQENGIYGVTGGTLMVVALACWLCGLTAVNDVLAVRYSRYAVLAKLVLVAGTVGGVCFAVRGFYDGALGLSRQTSIALLAEHPMASAVMFFGPGPLFPLGLIATGVALAKARLVHPGLGALTSLTGAIFPLTTILRLREAAVGLSVAMIIAFTLLAYSYATGRMHRRAMQTPINPERP